MASIEKNSVGAVECPFAHVCGNQQADVKRDKKGNLYIVCFQCEPASQHFTYGHASRIKALGLEKFVAPPPGPAPAPVADPPSPKKKPGVFDDLKI